MPSSGVQSGARTIQLKDRTNNELSSDQVDRVEKLLSQLEARQMALVPYGYWNEPKVPVEKFKNTLIAAAAVIVWLSTLVLAIAYVRHDPASRARGVVAAPSVLIPSGLDGQGQKAASSVEHLPKRLVASSERLDQIETVVEKSTLNLRHLATRVNPEAAKRAYNDPKIKFTQVTFASLPHPLSFLLLPHLL